MMKVVVCLVLVALQPLLLQAFVGSPATTTTQRSAATRSVGVEAFRKEGQQEPLQQQQQQQPQEDEATTLNRRTWIQRNVLTVSTALLTTTITTNTRPALAATRPPLNDLLYTILRVREATEQETRLISTGKFKDVQRANIKLAVKFMVENYRLADACVGAAAYLDGNERRIAAGNVGQAAVQNLVTILEYFDAADVQNLKVSCSVAVGWLLACLRQN